MRAPLSSFWPAFNRRSKPRDLGYKLATAAKSTSESDMNSGAGACEIGAQRLGREFEADG